MGTNPCQRSEFYVELYPCGRSFPAVIDHRRWHGWVRPRFRRDVAESIAHWANTSRNVGEPPWYLQCSFEDEILVVLEGRVARHHHAPDEQGRYALGANYLRWFLSVPEAQARHDEAAVLQDTSRLKATECEQLVSIDFGDDSRSFPAIVEQRLWNGWAVPRFRREVAEVVVSRLNAAHDADPEGYERAYWDGDTLVHVHPRFIGEDGYLPERIESDPDGRYAVGAPGWTWQIVTR